MTKHLLTVLIVALCAITTANSQEERAQDKLGTWLNYFDWIDLTDEHSLHADAQLRFWENVTNVNGGIVRLGYNFHITDFTFLSGGYTFGYFEDFDHTSSLRSHDLWQQFMQRIPLGAFTFEHRIRPEEVWTITDRGTDFFMRVRYRFLTTFHFGRDGASPWFINVGNEIFLVVNEGRLGENRLIPTVGYEFADHSNFQIGYMARIFTDVTFHSIQVFYNMHPDLR